MTPEERFIADLQKYGRVVAERHALQSMSKSDDLIDRFVNGPTDAPRALTYADIERMYRIKAKPAIEPGTLYGRPIRFEDVELTTKSMWPHGRPAMPTELAGDWLDIGVWPNDGPGRLSEMGREAIQPEELGAPMLCPTCGAYWACDC